MPEHRETRAEYERRIDARLRGAFKIATRDDQSIDFERLRRMLQLYLQDELQALWLLLFLRWWKLFAPNVFQPRIPSTDEVAGRAARFAFDRATSVAASFVRNVRELIDKSPGRPPPAADVLTDERAARIAITETTRTITDAETSSSDELGTVSLGRVSRRPIWTIEDASACEICFPLNGKGRELWGDPFPTGPPAHPHCRCWLEWIIDYDEDPEPRRIAGPGPNP